MIASETMPGQALKAEKMPGHWLLARLGKRVLRPGGRQSTHRMIEALNIGPSDAVIEFAPGLGETARLTLNKKPARYMAVERDQDAAAMVQKLLKQPEQRCVGGLAGETGLPDASATVVYGEAMLSMQTPEQKSRIVREAYRDRLDLGNERWKFGSKLGVFFNGFQVVHELLADEVFQGSDGAELVLDASGRFALLDPDFVKVQHV